MLRLGILLCVAVLALGSPPVTKSREKIEEFRQFLENSRTDKGVRIDSRMLENPQANIWENSGKYQGDIVLDDWQVDALVTDYAAGRAAYIWPNTRWPNNVVVYDFGVNEFNIAQQDAILRAIGWIEHFSCVRFRRRTAQDRNFVLLTGRADGCYASVGWWHDRGIHTMNLARATPGQGCLWVTVIIHEWLHVLGFFHMQSTYNRDNYVRINFANIVNGMGHNFDRYGPNLVSNLGLPYEYTSSMHYSSHAFSRNGQPTITPLRQFSGIMGQMDHVTHYDWVRLRRHYNCPGGWSSEEGLQQLKEEVERYASVMNTQDAPPRDDAPVFEDAQIFEDTQTFEDAPEFEDAQIFEDAQTFEDAPVFEDAQIFEDTQTFEDAPAFEDAQIFEDAQTFEDAPVFEDAQIFEDTQTFEDAPAFEGAQIFEDAQTFEDVPAFEDAQALVDAPALNDASAFEAAPPSYE